jgi:3-oxoacyl-[acyl-carrier protein] reductase
MTTSSLHGHVALVTGGSRGIGAAIVKMLAEAGAAVAINYRERAPEAETLANGIVAAGGRAVAIAADVSETSAVARLVERAKSELGPVDILINNAGIAMSMISLKRISIAPCRSISNRHSCVRRPCCR